MLFKISRMINRATIAIAADDKIKQRCIEHNKLLKKIENLDEKSAQLHYAEYYLKTDANKKIPHSMAIVLCEKSNYNIKDISSELFLSNFDLTDLLKSENYEERLNLSKILKNDQYLKQPLENFSLYDEITSSGGNSLANFVREQGNSYLDIVIDVAKNIKVQDSQNLDYERFKFFDEAKEVNKYGTEHQLTLNTMRKEYILKLEEQIIYKFMEMAYEKMKPQEKLKFDQAIQDIAISQGIINKKLSSGIAGLITIGEVGGFSTYMLMSMFFSKLGFGALGFSFFTGASSLLGIILGPVGWGISAGALIWSFSSPDKTKMAKIVLIISLIRLRLLEEKILV